MNQTCEDAGGLAPQKANTLIAVLTGAVTSTPASDNGGTDPTQPPESGRVYTHRWIVRCHWRNQPHGKERSERRITWIRSYV